MLNTTLNIFESLQLLEPTPKCGVKSFNIIPWSRNICGSCSDSKMLGPWQFGNPKFAFKHLKTRNKKSYLPRPVSEVCAFYPVACMPKKKQKICFLMRASKRTSSMRKQFFSFFSPHFRGFPHVASWNLHNSIFQTNMIFHVIAHIMSSEHFTLSLLPKRSWRQFFLKKLWSKL